MEITLVWISAVYLAAQGHVFWSLVLVVGWFATAKYFGFFDDDNMTGAT